MICKGCYREDTEGYCLSCRKKLFDRLRIPAVLSFDAPKADNIASFQEHSKRLSISGVQLKYSLRRENKELVFTEQSGEYILKPIPPSNLLVAVEDVPENEHLTMQMAEKLFGIQTAANALIHFKDGVPAYITRRFDVKPDGNKYQQEDFAQITSRAKATHGEMFKYGGSYLEIGEAIKKFVAAALPALERFFQLVIFNYVISNGDAHLKNFSLIRTEEGEYQLTPAYDIMSTVIHTPQESDTALDLYPGDIDSAFYQSYGYYGRENFLTLANKLGLLERRAIRMIDLFSARQIQMEQMVQQSFLTDASKTKYLANLTDRITRLNPK